MEKDFVKSISKYVESSSNEDYNDIIANDKRFEVFYNLSETRQSLFNWYPFKNNAKLLEYGGELGALTGLFCQKCEFVTSLADNEEKAEIIKKRHRKFKNLEVKVGYSMKELNIQYDYIVILDKLAYMCNGSKRVADYVEKLKLLLPYIKEDGTLLIATDNRYGLRYFCGEKDPITNIPFAGLNRYLDGSDGYMFSKNELITMINNLPNMKYKFYYPLPDYRFSQLIYTDNILPDKELKERVINYSLDKSTLVMSEKRLYEDIIDNEVFPFFANSFLIECNRKNIFSNINYAALSTDRERERAFVTMIEKNNVVTKKALFESGIEKLKLSIDNIKDIFNRGIQVVPHKFVDNTLVMPYIELPTLSKCLNNALKNNVPKFFELFDLLYDQILKSSEKVELKESTCFFENSDKEVWGPILKKAYIDMIPINCFFDGKNIIFFDQEFVKENFPASYIMFRALYYTYSFMNFANDIVPLNDMKEKYNLTNIWDYYKKVEFDFISRNRNFNTYSHFWEMRGVNLSQIKTNITRLLE